MTQTGHPEELLPEYVDGTLGEQDRRAVDAHLATCTVCRAEVGLAAGARQTLHRLPEEPVPFGVTRPVMDEVSGQGRRERTLWGQRIQWAAGIAAAAALVVVVAINLPDVGEDASTAAGDGGGAAITAEAGESATAPQAPQDRFAFPVALERSGRDFGHEALRGLVTEVANAVRDDSLKEPAGGSAPGETQEALDCVTTRSGSAEDEVLVRLIRATYEREPAYVAVHLQRPGAGQAPTRAIGRVVSADGSCELLDVTESRI